MSNEQLKPCPFDGGEAKLYRSFATRIIGGTGYRVSRYEVGCTVCGATAKAFDNMTDGASELAIAAWNRRAPTGEHHDN